jgi:F-type H+-transporting ATPase subunit b
MDLLSVKILVTQMIGFGIVFFILRRFAWGPILGMLEERRTRIANEIKASEDLRREAEELKAEYENQIKTIEAQARQRIQEAVAEGQKVSEEIQAKAHQDAEAITEKARANLEMEYKKARVELRAEIVAMAVGGAERLLQEELDSDEHRKVVDRFLTELQEQETG